MSSKKNQYQIDRKDAKNCFVESLSDYFAYGKIHFNFIAYDVTKPEGDRITNYVNIYIEADDFLEFCRKMESGELRYMIQQRKSTGDTTPLVSWLGGISANKLAESGKARADGMSMSRVAKLLCGNKADFIFVADSGAGEQNKKGLIIPRFGANPENHVTVSLTWDSLAELCMLTKEHYKAWLSSWYMVRIMTSGMTQNQNVGIQQINNSQPALQQSDQYYQQYSGMEQTDEQGYYYQQPQNQQYIQNGQAQPDQNMQYQ